MLGSWVGPYQVVEKLGEGGMGQVYLARDTRLHRRVALKTISPGKGGSAEQSRRALHEARAAAHLNHPNIAAIHDVVDANDCLCIVMEYVPGQTLQSTLRSGPLPVGKALDLGVQIARGVAFAHAAGVIHRDLKPANVIVTPDGHAKILDFGIAKTVSTDSWADLASHDQAAPFADEGGKRFVGTPAYLAPEIFQGSPATEQTDVYSLGVTLFEMLTGSRPFANLSIEGVREMAPHTPIPHATERNPEIPRPLGDVVARAMAIQPGERHGSADELLRDLQRLEKTETATGTTRRRRLLPRPLTSRPRIAIAMLVLIGVGSVALIAPRLAARRAFSNIPADARSWYDQGTQAVREGAFLTAARRFQRAIALHDAFPLAHARLAEARAELDDAKAKDSLLYVQKLAPNLSQLPSEDQQYLRAIHAMVTRSFPEAVMEYRRLLADRPQSAYAWVDLGRAQEANDQMADAAVSYERASVLSPQAPAGFLGMGSAFGKLQELDRALDAYKKSEVLYQAASNFEGVAEVCYRRGELLDKLERFGEARTELERALKLATESRNTYQRARCLLRLASVRAMEGDTTQARSLAEEGIVLGKDMPAVAAGGLINLGNVSFQQGDFAEARRLFETALQDARRQTARQTEAWALLSLASLDVQQGDDASALTHIEEVLPFYRRGGYRREQAIAQQLLGQVYASRGDFDRAIGAFEEQLGVARALRNEALAASADGQLAAVLVWAERAAQALPHAESAFRFYDSRGARANATEALLTKAVALTQLGRTKESSAVLAQLLRSDLQGLGGAVLQSRVLVAAADAAFSSGLLREARTLYQRALTLAAHDDVANRMWITSELARVMCHGGSVREARRLAGIASAWQSKHGPSFASALIMVRVAEVLSLLGDAEAALAAGVAAAADLERSKRRLSWLRALLLVSRNAERLGRADLAAAHLDKARSLAAELESEFGSASWRALLKGKTWEGVLDRSGAGLDAGPFWRGT